MTSSYSSGEWGKIWPLPIGCADSCRVRWFSTFDLLNSAKYLSEIPARNAIAFCRWFQTSPFGIEISFPLTEHSLANYSLAFCKSRNRTQPTGCQVLNYRFGIGPNAKLHKFLTETKPIRSFSASIKYIWTHRPHNVLNGNHQSRPFCIRFPSFNPGNYRFTVLLDKFNGFHVVHFTFLRSSQLTSAQNVKSRNWIVFFALFVVATAAEMGAGGSGCYENNHKYKVALIY